MTRDKLFMARAKEFYDSNNIVYQWTRKASAALRKNDVERFNECMCLVSLWDYNHYKTKRHGRHRALESWKNYVFHLRSHNAEYYSI